MSMEIEPRVKEYSNKEMWDTISELYLQYAFTPFDFDRWTSECLDALFEYHDEVWTCTVETRDWTLADMNKVKITFDKLWDLGYIDNHFVRYNC